MNVSRFVQNTEERSCFSTLNDPTIPFKENAIQLADAIKATHICFDVGQGHFDIPGKTSEFAKDIVNVSKRWGILG